jgi:hypothetical protein
MHLSIAPALRLYFGMSVSDQGTFGGVTQFANHPLNCGCKQLILKGEMAEWSMAHAWKAIRATLTEEHRNTPLCNRFSRLRPSDTR